MRLKVLVPSRVFADESAVTRIVAKTQAGSYGILPERLDCVAALVPGILTYETARRGVVYLAVDQGTLIKTGADVLVSVRVAIAGPDLSQLRESVEREFVVVGAQEKQVRAALDRMESSLLGRLAGFQK